MLKSLAIACLLVVGCKADKPDAAPGSAAATEAQTPGAPGRSGKVDLGMGGRRAPSLGSDDSAPSNDMLEQRRKARMAALDTDGDGQISEAERKAARDRRAADMLKRLDADGDGKVTADELAKSPFRRLDSASVDADKDGNITVDEISKALESQGRQWGMGRLRGRRGMAGSDLGGPGGPAAGSDQ